MAMKYLIPIPKGTPEAKCRSCQQLIFWSPHPTSGRNHPVSVADPDAKKPTKTEDGQGISHFADCPNADKHRRSK